MQRKLTRREALRLAALGGLGALAACAPAPAAQTPPTAAPTSAPPAPTVAPTVAPTAAPTSAPAATVAPTAAPQPAPTVAPAPTAAPTAAPQAALGAAMALAAATFLDSLNAEQRSVATYPMQDNERRRWHWTTPRNVPRNGLPLRDMSAEQRAAAMALLQTGASAAGYQKATEIMALQTALGSDPELYFVTVFGDPGAGPWGWRWEGHHLSRHYTLAGEAVTAAPLFHGAWPTTTDAGLRAMAREEDAARELVSALAGAARDQAIFDTRTLTRHVTDNAPYVTPLDPVGVAYGDLDAAAQARVDEIIGAYLGSLPDAVAAPMLARLDAAGRAQVRFGWAGPLEPRRPHYYRLQGPTFLLEFDNSRNGGTHIHSVWRDFDEDFGRNVV